jgi:kynurenine formamidase
MADKPRNWGKWGAEDERGTLNYITPGVTLRAAHLVQKGKVYPLAIPLKASSPIWPTRHKNWHVATYHNQHGPGVGGAEDILMIHTHGSTHVDALSHLFADGQFYNGYSAAEALDSRGTKKNAIDKIGAIVTRGVLLDFAGYHKVEHLPAEHVITPEEVEKVAAAEGVSFESGDAILFRTGWQKTWDEKNPDPFNKRQPGPSLAVAQWAGDREIAVMAADNSAVEAFPLEGGLVVHREFIRNQGGYLMELLSLDALAADKVYEFMFVVAPLNITMGLGSPITPLAIC